MEKILNKENSKNSYLNQNASVCNNKERPNRHVSVLYGIQYLKKVPLVKKYRKTQFDCFANIDKK